MRGLLSKREMQIALLIIRESWGWDKGTSNWTKRSLLQTFMNEKTGLDKAVISKMVSLMLKQEKIFRDEKGRYRFNEHPETWKLTEGQLLTSKKVVKKSTESCQKVNWKLTKGQLLVDKTSTFDGLEIDVSTIAMKELQGLLKLPKESIKEIFKEIFKQSVQALRDFYEQKITKLRTFDDTRKRICLRITEKRNTI